MDEFVVEPQYLWVVIALSAAYLGRFVCQRICGYRSTVGAWVPALAVTAAMVLSVNALLDDRSITVGWLS